MASRPEDKRLPAEGTIFEAKRKMGQKFNFQVNGKDYTPEQISAFIYKN